MPLLPATVTPRPSPVVINLEADDYELNLAATAENLNIPAEYLYDQYLVVATETGDKDRNPVTGYPTGPLWDTVSRFLAIIFNALHMLQAHAVVLPYDSSDSSQGQLA